MATYKHKVYGRVNGRYRTELREENRELPEGLTLVSTYAPEYLSKCFGAVKHRRGNPPM